jgi:uncharacterized protein (DUF1800 family)
MPVKRLQAWCRRVLILPLIICAGQAAAQTLPVHKLSLADARHLASRTGLGVTVEELQALTGKSRAEATDYIMDGFSVEPALAMPAWTRDPAPLYWTRQDLSPANASRFDRRRDAELTGLRQWWVDTMLATSSPQTERMVVFWHDHFATSYHGVSRQSKAMARQNSTFRQYAVGNYRQLLKAMLRDPALLNFLDNLSNRKGAPNENLARELLELFTLGEGNFDEHTVREAARALTGYGVSQNSDLAFEYQRWNADKAQKTLFGQSGNFDGDNLIDLILAQPAAPYHIAGKFWQAFVSDHPATRAQLQPLVTALLKSDYEISALYRALLEQDAFWSADSRAAMVKSPVQLIVGAARALEYPKKFNQQIPSLLARSGMNLFAPPNVAGFPTADGWITPGRLLNRYAAIKQIALSPGVPSISPDGVASKSMPTMVMNNTMVSDSQAESAEFLALHIAAEDYLGPVDYRVELLSDADTLLWDSGVLAVRGGHETTQYGRVSDPDMLPWQVERFAVQTQALQSAASVRVHFLNDDAGYNGDRNLFVRGALIGAAWLDSTTGTQISKCPPASSLNAGNLYCQGYVSLPVRTPLVKAPQSEAHFHASSVHVNWVRAEGDQLDLTLTLQGLHANKHYYPTYSFHLHSTQGAAPRIELNTFGCWPHCVQRWPDCAWMSDAKHTRMTLAFPLEGAGSDKVLQCHYEALNEGEVNIVNSLFRHAADLLQQARLSPREFSAGQLVALARWSDFLNLHQPRIRQRFAKAQPISIDATVRKAEQPLQGPTRFNPGLVDPAEVERHLWGADLSIVELLLPGVSQSAFPEFAVLDKLPAAEQLQLIVDHPVFQLH